MQHDKKKEKKKINNEPNKHILDIDYKKVQSTPSTAKVDFADSMSFSCGESKRICH